LSGRETVEQGQAEAEDKSNQGRQRQAEAGRGRHRESEMEKNKATTFTRLGHLHERGTAWRFSAALQSDVTTEVDSGTAPSTISSEPAYAATDPTTRRDVTNSDDGLFQSRENGPPYLSVKRSGRLLSRVRY